MVEVNLAKMQEIIKQNKKKLLNSWMEEQLKAHTLRSDLMLEDELKGQSAKFLELFNEAIQKGEISDISGNNWEDTRDLLQEISRSRNFQGFTPSETAEFVFSFKQPLFTLLQEKLSEDSIHAYMWQVTVLLDKLGLYTCEMSILAQEGIIKEQQLELLELSTPVIQLWEGILALPLIGTLDSERTQTVMESLLQKIVETRSGYAIIDITGVPTVDTLVAQHLIKTVAAARLMGAECMISGIRPQIAQTIVQLGIKLDVITKASLADAFELALRKSRMAVIKKEE